MKLLIAIPTTRKEPYATRTRVVRETWAKRANELGIDLRYFYGDAGTCNCGHPELHQTFYCPKAPDDEITILGCPDDYAGLTKKVQIMFEWAFRSGYDYVLKIDDDTYLNVDRFLECGFEKHDYMGYVNQGWTEGQETLYCSGAAYCVSRKAMEIIINSPLPNDWAEDRQVGLYLIKNGIDPHSDDRFHFCVCDICFPKIQDDFIAVHTSPRRELMHELHAKCLSLKNQALVTSA